MVYESTKEVNAIPDTEAPHKTPAWPERLRDVALLLACLVPLFVLFGLISTGLYSTPESDDFCFSYLYYQHGLAHTIGRFYVGAIGRIVPMVLITLPAMISKAASIDLFIVYSLTIVVFLLAFVAVTIWAIHRLWPHAPKLAVGFLGVTLAATIFGNAISLREMMYWMPGVACYLVPAALMLILFVELFASAAHETPVARPAVLAGICFLVGLCNEFTPVWLLGMITASFLFRRCSSHPFPQDKEHALLFGATIAGFAVLLAAPGNIFRMAQYPAGGKLLPSIESAIQFTLHDWNLFLNPPNEWLAIISLFSLFVMPSRKIEWRKALLFSSGTILLFLGCTFIAWFAAYYATGEILALRARNEVFVMIVISLTCSVMLLSQMIGQWVTTSRPVWLQIVGAIGGGILCLSLLNARSMTLLHSERPQFDTFWLESLSRHASLKLSPDADIVVPRRTARPTVLMEEDLTENPARLPNDCVAAFYGKKSVVMRGLPVSQTPR